MIQITEQTTTQRMVRIKLPGPLHNMAPVKSDFCFEGETVLDIFKEIDRAHPEFLSRVTEANGQLRPYINIFVDGKSIQNIRGWETPIRGGEKITVMLSIAGG